MLVNTLFLLVKSPYFWAKNMKIQVTKCHQSIPSAPATESRKERVVLRAWKATFVAGFMTSSCPWTSVSVYETSDFFTCSGVWYGMAIVMSMPWVFYIYTINVYHMYTTCIDMCHNIWESSPNRSIKRRGLTRVGAQILQAVWVLGIQLQTSL